MIIDVASDLSSLTISAHGKELASIMGIDRDVAGNRVYSWPDNKEVRVHAFANPVLMTDTWRTAQLDPTKRDTLFALYGCRPRIVHYDGVQTTWDRKHDTVWCPSIDTVLFAKALRRMFMQDGKNDIKNGMEIGCGSGFLSKYVVAKCPQIKSWVANDINPDAIDAAMQEFGPDPRVQFIRGDGLRALTDGAMAGRKLDLLLCNPPYIPRPGSIDDNPYEGVGVLRHLLHHAKEYLAPGGVMLTNISSLCKDIVVEGLPKGSFEVVDDMEVPLKVNNVLNNPDWIQYLESRGLQRTPKFGYDYWQTLEIVKITHK